MTIISTFISDAILDRPMYEPISVAVSVMDVFDSHRYTLYTCCELCVVCVFQVPCSVLKRSEQSVPPQSSASSSCCITKCVMSSVTSLSCWRFNSSLTPPYYRYEFIWSPPHLSLSSSLSHGVCCFFRSRRWASHRSLWRTSASCSCVPLSWWRR